MNQPPTQHSPGPNRPVSTFSWLLGALEIMKLNIPIWLLAGSVMMVAITASIGMQWFGQVVISLLTPVLMGVLIQGCANAEAGAPMSIKSLKPIFSDHEKMKRLLLLGCFLLIFYIALVAICVMLYLSFGGDTVIAELRQYMNRELSEEQIAALFGKLMPLIILAFTVICLYFLASFFSIPHVVLRNADAFGAILLSLSCSLRHITTIIGVCLVVFILSVVASFLLINPRLAFIFMIVVLWPFTVCIQYVAYVSIFGNPQAPLQVADDNTNDTILKA